MTIATNISNSGIVKKMSFSFNQEQPAYLTFVSLMFWNKIQYYYSDVY